MPTSAPLGQHIERNQHDLLVFLSRRAPREAEELAQETWLRVARANPSFQDESSFRAYAFTVAKRLLIDHYRRSATRVSLVPLEGGREPSSNSDPLGAACATQTLRVVQDVLDGLKPELAEVFRLRTTTQMSFRAIAAHQAVGLNTALGRMHQATKAIQRALNQQGLLPEVVQ
ncbi:MAG: sigma-70 family RNA polymerase sigma factor [Rhodobacterales bacterium]|nr:sigma-70 family RNA polymerase sigma factor [Rhodobacterales bacterium]